MTLPQHLSVPSAILALVVVACSGGDAGDDASPADDAVTGDAAPADAAPADAAPADGPTPRLALWLAKKDDLLAHPEACYHLVMSGWFTPEEAATIRSHCPDARLLAGLTHTWVLDDPGWRQLLVTVANEGNPDGPLQITDDMFLGFDDDEDGAIDRRCSLPGWPDIEAVDPRSTAWRELIVAFYDVVGTAAQHDGAIVDMVDEYPFCEGAWSGAVAAPLSAAAWIAGQDAILGAIRDAVPAEKWMIANAGHDFPTTSTLPRHFSGYLLENFLGAWGLPDLPAGLASAARVRPQLQPPAMVIFAADTDDTGTIDETVLRTGLVTSLLVDGHFAFDLGAHDHGAVTGYWFPAYYQVDLGSPTGPYEVDDGLYLRQYQGGAVAAATAGDATVTFSSLHRDVTTDVVAASHVVPGGDARIFVRAP